MFSTTDSIITTDVAKRPIIESAIGSAAFFIRVDMSSANSTIGDAESTVSSILMISVIAEGICATLPPIMNRSGLKRSFIPNRSIHSPPSSSAPAPAAASHHT